jgi:hypothetical protein
MLKKFVFAAALVVASSPAFVSAQDFFFSFDENSAVSTSEVTPDATSGTVFLFGGADFDFNQLDLNFTSSDSSVAAITGGVVFNPGSPDSGTAATANGGAFTSFALLMAVVCSPHRFCLPVSNQVVVLTTSVRVQVVSCSLQSITTSLEKEHLT